jgi:pimeloyl-ACP methyl ester carboxylesterase
VTRPFVLVHGSGGGPWCWDGVRPLLEERGSRVLAPQLPGMDDPATSLDDHARAVASEIEREDLGDVILVGHSYGGMPVAAAAELVPERLARLVFLDASDPRDGESLLDGRPDIGVLRDQAVDGLIPPIDPWFAGIETEEQAELLREHITTTPARVYDDPVRLSSPEAARLPRTFVWFTRSGYSETARRAREDGYDYHELDAPHMAIVTAPDAVAQLLLSLRMRPR